MQILFTGKISKISRINGYEFVTDTSLSLAEKYITWILFNYYTATSNVCSKKSIPSTVYCAWYTFFWNGRF